MRLTQFGICFCLILFFNVSPPKKKRKGKDQTDTLFNFIMSLRKDLYKYSSIFFHKIGRSMTNSFYAPKITLIQKNKCCRPSYLISIDSKALAEILTSQIQENFNMVIHDKLILIPETQRWYNTHKLRYCLKSTDTRTKLYHLNRYREFI